MAGSQRAAFLQPFAYLGIEQLRFIIGVGQDDAAGTRIRLPVTIPRIDQLSARGLARVGGVDMTRLGIATYCLARPSGGKFARCLALPPFLLATDVHDFDGTVTFGRGAERGARLDRLELLRITDKNDFRALAFSLGHNTLELARADHSRLVDHEDVLAGQPLAILPPLMFEAGERARGDA